MKAVNKTTYIFICMHLMKILFVRPWRLDLSGTSIVTRNVKRWWEMARQKKFYIIYYIINNHMVKFTNRENLNILV